MSKSRIARPRPVRLPLNAVKVLQVEDFAGRPEKPPVYDSFFALDLAKALDFWCRLEYRRSKEQQAAWLDPEAIQQRLHCCLTLLTHEDLHDLRVEMPELTQTLSDFLEILALRAGMAADSPEARARRYQMQCSASDMATGITKKPSAT